VQKGVAVRRRVRDVLQADVPGCPGAVVDHHWLAKDTAQLLGERA
jgi:hypothetical protein